MNWFERFPAYTVKREKQSAGMYYRMLPFKKKKRVYENTSAHLCERNTGRIN